MKKILTMALCATMLLTLIACTSENDVDVNDVNLPTPPARVELPEWSINTNPFDITDDMSVSNIHGIPDIAESSEYRNLCATGMLKFMMETRDGAVAFRGVVIDQWVTWADPSINPMPSGTKHLYTDTEFLIQEVLYGDLEVGETTVIRQLGGIDESVERVRVWFNHLRVDLPIGEEYIVFADRPWNTDETVRNGLSHYQSFHWIANPYGDGRGISALSDESIMTNTDAEIIAHPLNLAREGQEVIITREILAEIAALGGHELGAPIPPEVMEKAQAAIDQRTEDLARWEAEQREVE